ncbi:putative endonuclease [Parapedobacter composti]|uniref:UPF0102 protein SAMN05421747_1153 n=1 Tax=Parapedobacter composti TaxID=623281 RepID=A0A1I1KE29_9SPHI|nr:YraN family protein [Parapedobacter composti]SFC56988.1 putative endonuclease [Parapedobacter composti]
MASAIEIGRNGEQAAVGLLKQHGYRIHFCNWRHKQLEVDIIAQDGPVLVFVEVKSRTGYAYGMPYEFVDALKQARLVRAANHYIALHHYGGEIRFDVVSILYTDKQGNYQARLIKDAFWPD